MIFMYSRSRNFTRRVADHSLGIYSEALQELDQG